MKIGITKLLAENIAPDNVRKLVIFDGNTKICDVDITKMKPELGEPLYSFVLLSDIHLWKVNTSGYGYSNEKFDNALSYSEDKGCLFCIVSGDLTVTGFYLRTNEKDASTQYEDLTQFTQYKEICGKHTIPVYELMGNHESYYDTPISNNLDKMEIYTGKGELSYTITQGNDLFILCGQPSGGVVMTNEDFQWLSDTLETNKDKRCFVFVHPYIEEDSGDPLDVRENSIFDYWGTTNRNAFMNLMRQYDNAVLFHGHSHMKFEYQKDDINANYTERNGFKSVHVPSLAKPRDIDFDTMTSRDDGSAGQGYIVDVYEDCIVLNGWDFVNSKPIPFGTYKIMI